MQPARILQALIAALVVAPAPSTRAAAREITLAAAASLRNVLPPLIKAYGGPAPVVSYGSSGDLRKQVEGGAPIDGVLFASADPVDALIKAGLADPATRRVIATNQLVLIGPKGGRPLTFATLDKLPKGELLAVGEPNSVPVGQYARAALSKLGKWKALEGRMVFGGDVAAVLAYARRGEVAAAIVYRTDIRGIEDVVLLDQARGDWAPRTEIVVAVTRGGDSAAGARAFLTFLSTPVAQKILREHGFGAP
ncbi:MAG TPA: molybdate ABC transporter substrate-binding protein [Polyangia bacterium]|nr:molybdate ABC transporter substrate-binding protein [Polyangia bacterium]